MTHQIDTPTSGSTITCPSGLGEEVVNNSATLATLTVIFPPSPSDGDIFGLSSIKAVTVMTLSTSDGSSIIGSASGNYNTSGGGAHMWIYDSASTTWFRTV